MTADSRPERRCLHTVETDLISKRKETTTMSPVAAYYIYLARENERRNAAPTHESNRPSRPSLIERARRRADGLRSASRLAHSA